MVGGTEGGRFRSGDLGATQGGIRSLHSGVPAGAGQTGRRNTLSSVWGLHTAGAQVDRESSGEIVGGAEGARRHLSKE